MMPGIVSRAWGSLTWRDWAAAAGFGAAVCALKPLVHFEIAFYWAHWRILFDMPYWIATAWIFLGAIALADATVPATHRPTWRRYACAMAAASAACVALALAIAPYVPWPPRQVIAGSTFKPTWVTDRGKRIHAGISRYALPAALHGSLGGFMFVTIRNSRRAARALADAEIERSEAARRLLQSSLEAARAHVEPEAVLDALAEIESTYDSDPVLADSLMDRLIQSLREAVPKLRTEAAHA